MECRGIVNYQIIANPNCLIDPTYVGSIKYCWFVIADPACGGNCSTLIPCESSNCICQNGVCVTPFVYKWLENEQIIQTGNINHNQCVTLPIKKKQYYQFIINGSDCDYFTNKGNLDDINCNLCKNISFPSIYTPPTCQNGNVATIKHTLKGDGSDGPFIYTIERTGNNSTIIHYTRLLRYDGDTTGIISLPAGYFYRFSVKGKNGADTGCEFILNSGYLEPELCPTRTPTRTSTPTLSLTSTPTATSTPGVTPTSTPTLTETPTLTPTQTPTLTQTITSTSTQTPSVTLTNTSTQTPTLSLTQTPTVTLTRTVTRTVTSTQTPTLTKTLTRTVTQTVTNTSTRTPTLTSTSTPTLTLSSTATQTPTLTPTLTQTVTQTVTQSITATPTVTPTLTRTVTATRTPTLSVTSTPTQTVTQTVTRTVTTTPSGCTNKTINTQDNVVVEFRCNVPFNNFPLEAWIDFRGIFDSCANTCCNYLQGNRQWQIYKNNIYIGGASLPGSASICIFDYDDADIDICNDPVGTTYRYDYSWILQAPTDDCIINGPMSGSGSQTITVSQLLKDSCTCPTPTPTPTPTITVTSTSTPTRTSTPTLTPTLTITSSPTRTPTLTPTTTSICNIIDTTNASTVIACTVSELRIGINYSDILLGNCPCCSTSTTILVRYRINNGSWSTMASGTTLSTCFTNIAYAPINFCAYANGTVIEFQYTWTSNAHNCSTTVNQTSGVTYVSHTLTQEDKDNCSACDPVLTLTPTPTLTRTVTATQTSTPTITPTITPTLTRTVTPTRTSTITPTLTRTVTSANPCGESSAIPYIDLNVSCYGNTLYKTVITRLDCTGCCNFSINWYENGIYQGTDFSCGQSVTNIKVGQYICDFPIGHVFSYTYTWNMTPISNPNCNINNIITPLTGSRVVTYIMTAEDKSRCTNCTLNSPTPTPTTTCGSCYGNQIVIGPNCQCGCAPGLTLCSEQCVNLNNSSINCGVCGNTCNQSDNCINGVCTPQPYCGTCGNWNYYTLECNPDGYSCTGPCIEEQVYDYSYNIIRTGYNCISCGDCGEWDSYSQICTCTGSCVQNFSCQEIIGGCACIYDVPCPPQGSEAPGYCLGCTAYNLVYDGTYTNGICGTTIVEIQENYPYCPGCLPYCGEHREWDFDLAQCVCDGAMCLYGIIDNEEIYGQWSSCNNGQDCCCLLFI